MSSRPLAEFTGRYILGADEDPAVVSFVIRILREDGHSVFHAYDGRSAVELVYSLRKCDLVISNSRVDGLPGVDLIRQLRHDRPAQPIIYLANVARSSSDIEGQLPADVPILREPFGGGIAGDRRRAGRRKSALTREGLTLPSLNRRPRLRAR